MILPAIGLGSPIPVFLLATQKIHENTIRHVADSKVKQCEAGDIPCGLSHQPSFHGRVRQGAFPGGPSPRQLRSMDALGNNRNIMQHIPTGGLAVLWLGNLLAFIKTGRFTMWGCAASCDQIAMSVRARTAPLRLHSIAACGRAPFHVVRRPTTFDPWTSHSQCLAFQTCGATIFLVRRPAGFRQTMRATWLRTASCDVSWRAYTLWTEGPTSFPLLFVLRSLFYINGKHLLETAPTRDTGDRNKMLIRLKRL